MIHLYIHTQKIDAIDPACNEETKAFEAAQSWANDLGEPVDLYRYEGHETLEGGEMLGTVQPQPLQLALIGKPEVLEVETWA